MRRHPLQERLCLGERRAAAVWVHHRVVLGFSGGLVVKEDRGDEHHGQAGRGQCCKQEAIGEEKCRLLPLGHSGLSLFLYEL